MIGALGRLPLPAKLLLTFPVFGWQATNYMKRSYQKVFYVDGHPQASLGYIALFSVVASLVDAFSDPFMANLTDNSRPRHMGRRRIFLIAGAIGTVVVYTLSYTPLLPPGQGASLWYGAFHVLSRLCDTAFLIPLQGWVAEASPSASERSGLWVLYNSFEVGGIAFGTVLPGFLARAGGVDCNDPADGCVSFPLVNLSFSMIMLVGCVLLVLFGRERSNQKLQSPKQQGMAEDRVVPTIISTWLNRPFRLLLVSVLVRAFGEELPIVVLPFLTRDLLGDACMDPSLSFSLVAGVSLVFRMLSLPVWWRVARRFGKFRGYVCFIVMLASVDICIVVLQRDTGNCVQTAVAAVLFGFWGVANGGIVLLKALVSDVVDYDEMLTGKRREGQYLMSIEFLPKFLQVLSEAAPLLLLAYFGYRRAAADDPFPLQPQAVVWVLRLCISLVPAGFVIMGGCALFWYPKEARDEETHRMILEAIRTKHKQGLVAVDPWYPDRSLPPPCAPTAHSGLLSYLLPSELGAMIGEGEDAEANLALPVWGMLRWMALAIPLSGVGLVLLVWGWDDLASDLGASLSPVGLILVGFAVLLVWFHGTRALALRRIIQARVPTAELASHYNSLCRFGELALKLRGCQQIDDVVVASNNSDGDGRTGSLVERPDGCAVSSAAEPKAYS